MLLDKTRTIFGIFMLAAVFVAAAMLQPIPALLRAETPVEPVMAPALTSAGTSPESVIRDKLNDTFQFDIAKPIPLGEALALFQKESGTIIVPDIRALEAAGITLDTPVTLRLPVRMPFKDILNYMAKQAKQPDPGYVIKDEVIRFGLKDNAMYQCAYYAGDIVVRKGNDVEFQPVIDYIQTMVRPESWENGASITPYYPNLCLVIRQSDPIHKEIVKLLRDLRRYNNLQIQFKIEVLSNLNDVISCGGYTIFNGELYTDFPSWDKETVIQLTPISAKPVNEYYSAMNRPLRLIIPGQSKISVKGTVGQKDGVETIKFSVSVDDQIQATRTFYASPLLPEEEEAYLLHPAATP